MKNELVRNVIDIHNQLLNEIGDYNFDSQHKKSYGYNQNETNDNIIMQLENFEYFFNQSMDTISNYLNNNNKDEENETVLEINYLLQKGYIRLKKQDKVLYYAKEAYYSVWNKAFNYGYKIDGLHELGHKKSIWKKEKNTACQKILELYSDIYYIIDKLSLEDHLINNNNDLYDMAMNDIIHGPYYYSYLSDIERNQLTKQNKLKKLRNKEC